MIARRRRLSANGSTAVSHRRHAKPSCPLKEQEAGLVAGPDPATSQCGIIHVKKFCCSHTSTPSSTVSKIECLNVFANTTPSLPLSSVVATPVEMFCGEIILPITPPDEFVAAIRMGLRLSCRAATTCRFPNNALPDVSLPER